MGILLLVLHFSNYPESRHISSFRHDTEKEKACMKCMVFGDDITIDHIAN